MGLVATAIDLAVLSLMVSVLGWSPRHASLPALALGIVAQFVGNKVFAFENRERAWLRQGAKFALVEGAAFALNLALFDVAVRHVPMPAVAVRLITTNAVYLGFCLPLWSRIFREKVATS